MKRIYIAVALASMISLSACDQPQQSESSFNPVPPSIRQGEVIMKAGDKITITEPMVESFADQRAGEDGKLSDAERQKVINDLVDLELLTQYAMEQNLPDDPAVAANLLQKYYSVLAAAAVSHYLEKNPVDDAALRETYEQWAAEQQGQEYRAGHILVDEKEKAEAIIDKLEEGGDFAELAKAESKDSSAAEGGDLGWFSSQQVVPPFAKAVTELSPGEYTHSPIETEFGWHIIKLYEQREREVPPLEEVKSRLSRLAQINRIQALLNQLRREAGIDTTDVSPAPPAPDEPVANGN